MPGNCTCPPCVWPESIRSIAAPRARRRLSGLCETRSRNACPIESSEVGGLTHPGSFISANLQLAFAVFDLQHSAGDIDPAATGEFESDRCGVEIPVMISEHEVASERSANLPHRAGDPIEEVVPIEQVAGEDRQVGRSGQNRCGHLLIERLRRGAGEVPIGKVPERQTIPLDGESRMMQCLLADVEFEDLIERNSQQSPMRPVSVERLTAASGAVDRSGVDDGRLRFEQQCGRFVQPVPRESYQQSRQSDGAKSEVPDDKR